MFAPNILPMRDVFDNSNAALATPSMTVDVLGFSVGPLFFAPLSGVYGRAVVYRSCSRSSLSPVLSPLVWVC